MTTEPKPTPAPAPPKCEHNYVKTPYHVGMCIIYECTKCGDEYEKDVS